MSNEKKETKRFDPLPPPPMREPLERAQAEPALSNAEICERLEDLLDDALRAACAKKAFDLQTGNCEGCQRVDEPKIVPCIHLRWGDGPQDHLETDDTEVLCITVCNPYSNVTLKNFTLQLIVTDADGTPVANQADGTPSVVIKPGFNICFDDIPPCTPQGHNQQSCISREVVMINRGAVPGKYHVYIVYCFEACFTELNFNPAAFELELVSS